MNLSVHGKQVEGGGGWRAHVLQAAGATAETCFDGRSEGVAAASPVAEIDAAILSLTVGEAVMHLDLTGRPAFLFPNRAHGGPNMIHRRPNDKGGRVDPQHLSAR